MTTLPYLGEFSNLIPLPPPPPDREWLSAAIAGEKTPRNLQDYESSFVPWKAAGFQNPFSKAAHSL
jgi:hypothetical protein